MELIHNRIQARPHITFKKIIGGLRCDLDYDHDNDHF